MNPTISVGLPVYNGASYLPEALDSILSQTYGDFELIISDNASTDGTRELCEAVAKSDKRVHYYRQAVNRGVVENSNLVFALARGDFFRWASHDDYTDPSHLEKCLAALRRTQAVVAFSQTVYVNGAGDCIDCLSENLESSTPDPCARYAHCFENLVKSNVPYGLIRCTVLKQTKLFQPYIGSDIDLILELALYGAFVEVPEPLFFRRIHPQAGSSLQMDALVQHYFPGRRMSCGFDELTRQLYRLRAVLRSPLSTWDKLRLFPLLARHCYWNRQSIYRQIAAMMPSLGRTQRLTKLERPSPADAPRDYAETELPLAPSGELRAAAGSSSDHTVLI